MAWGMPSLPGPYVSAYPAGAYGAYGYGGVAGVAGAGVAGAGVALPPSYAAANYGVATGMVGGPTLPLASVVARNAERVAANSDALLRLYQHANAGLFATNQMLLHLQNEVQAAEGTWSTVPMEFPAAYGAAAGGVMGGGLVAANAGVLPAAAVGVPSSTMTTTSTSGGTSTTVTSTSVATSQGKLKNSFSADAAAAGMATAIKATASSPVAAKAAISKAISGSSSAPPGFHLAWVPNKAASLASQPASAVLARSAWDWRPLAKASLQSSVYKTENTYPYISGPYHAGATGVVGAVGAFASPYQQAATSPFRPL